MGTALSQISAQQVTNRNRHNIHGCSAYKSQPGTCRLRMMSWLTGSRPATTASRYSRISRRRDLSPRRPVTMLPTYRQQLEKQQQVWRVWKSDFANHSIAMQSLMCA